MLIHSILLQLWYTERLSRAKYCRRCRGHKRKTNVPGACLRHLGILERRKKCPATVNNARGYPAPFRTKASIPPNFLLTSPSLPGNCSWLQDTAWPKVKSAPRGSLHPVTGLYVATESWAPIRVRANFEGPRQLRDSTWPLLRLDSRSASPFAALTSLGVSLRTCPSKPALGSPS